ncbi:hypothetical protein ABIA33_005121 [Streptacidiphilus sp. MAP12-16]|uniref:hypothetical protein n=1 Tax=Streptacidiphilus sp. MAP12-16 TaxID=3156300 RepID=UPI0035154A82
MDTLHAVNYHSNPPPHLGGHHCHEETASMLQLRKTRRAIALTAATLALGGGVTITATGAAHAAPTSCSWTREGNDGTEYVRDGNGNLLIAGWIEQQYDYCGSTRAVFYWNNSFRTTGHPGITGAWVHAINQSYDDLGTGSDSGGFVGSSAGASVPTASIGVHAGGTNSWTGESDLRVTYSNGAVRDCTAWSDTHDYHTGNTIAGGVRNGTCSL